MRSRGRFMRQNGRYFPTQDAQLIFEQINGIYKKVDDLTDLVGKIGRGQYTAGVDPSQISSSINVQTSSIALLRLTETLAH